MPKRKRRKTYHKKPEPEPEIFSDVPFTKEANLPGKAEIERWNCWNGGLDIVSPDKIIVSDYSNKTVKLINVKDGEKESYLNLETIPHKVKVVWLDTRPWDVCAISRSKAAVTLPHGSLIQLLTIRKGISPGKHFEINGQCLGIDYKYDKLVVTCEKPARVDVMNLKGHTLQTLQYDSLEQPLFSQPYFIKLSKEDGKEFMYVTDASQRCSITKLSMDGDVLYSYKLGEFANGPRGIALYKDGEVFVCKCDSIYLLPKAGDKALTVLNTIDRAFSIGYDSTTGKMYIGTLGSERDSVLCFGNY